MTIKIELGDEAARIVEQQIATGRYPDPESAVTAALLLLDDAAMNWDDVDAEAVRRMIAEADTEGGEVSMDEAMAKLDDAIASASRRR